MKIDVAAHIMPPAFKDLVYKSDRYKFSQKDFITAYPSIWDLEQRFRIMDKFPDVVQLLSFVFSLDEMAEPDGAAELAKRVNNEMAELVYRYPDRFAGGLATVSTANVDTALLELDRAINDLHLRGVEIRIPINGKPVDSQEFMPLYEKMCQYDLPIFWHPDSKRSVPDYPGESESKYWIWHTWGLMYQTTISMTRLVFSGVLERYPNLKIVTHHCGGMVSFFFERLVNQYSYLQMRSNLNFVKSLTRPHIEYFRKFYNDTAIQGNAPALECAASFFGADRLLFGADFPMDAQLGVYCLRKTIEGIEQMEITEADKQKIFEGNARKLMRLPL